MRKPMPNNPIHVHRAATLALARNLKWTDVYHWIVEHGYFPESYVLPPCFRVRKHPKTPKLYTRVVVNKKVTRLNPTPHECCYVHFPKSDLTDRDFGIIHPELHNDIAYHIARNWKAIVDAMIPRDSAVTCYSFPVPLDTRHPGRVGRLRSGRLIYEFLWMTEEDLASVAYRYTHLVRADIKGFYPSIYTHSIAWALHGKKRIRKGGNRFDYRLLGNRLDRLFQYSNDQRTNGLPIGPVVSDIAAEIIAAAVDRHLTTAVRARDLECEMVRFKDDYRILVKSEADGRTIVKLLQAALKEFSLELSEGKTSLHALPNGLFRSWVSRYHAVHPRKKHTYSWKAFRELYLAVLAIDEEYPGTGVIDRFLADIVSKGGHPKVFVTGRNLQKALSMLLMLGARRIKAFPKVLAIIEAITRSPFGDLHTDEIVSYLQAHLETLAKDEARNKYLITWLAYFFMSNGLSGRLTFKPAFKDPITRSVFANRGAVFKSSPDFTLFEGSVTVGKRLSMLKHLDIFNPPGPT